MQTLNICYPCHGRCQGVSLCEQIDDGHFTTALVIANSANRTRTLGDKLREISVGYIFHS